MDAGSFVINEFHEMRQEGVELRERAARIRDALDASPVYQQITEGLDRLSNLPGSQFRYAILYHDERSKEPKPNDVIVELQTNMKLFGNIVRHHFFSPSKIEPLEDVISIGITAGGHVVTMGQINNVDVQAGEAVYPVPDQSRKPKQQVIVDRANEGAVQTALSFVSRAATSAGAVSVLSVTNSVPKPSADQDLREALGPKREPGNWFTRLWHND